MVDYRTERARGSPAVTEFPPQHDLPQRRGYTAYASAAAAGAPAKYTFNDVASVLGLPAGALSPALMAALEPVLEELDSLRWQADQDDRRRALLERIADRHSLLPCYNRRAFLREVDAVLGAGDESGMLALLHVGGVESLRLAYGLQAGDGALRHACATILGNLRASDMVGCIGGSDFAVLLLGRQPAAADKLAAVGRRINDPPFTWAGQPMTLEVRIGLCALAAGTAADQALAAADRALRGVE
jgi:diguanylate cyclase (GGDEF)-like protein